MNDKVSKIVGQAVERIKRRVRGTQPGGMRKETDGELIALAIINLAETAFREGQRAERRRRKASCARRWRRKQEQVITPAHHYPECQCKAQTPYKGHWHEKDCPLWEPELMLRLTGKTSTADR